MRTSNKSTYVQAALFIALLLTLSNLSALKGAGTSTADQTKTVTTITTESFTETLTTLETTTATETSTQLYGTTVTTEVESTTTAWTFTTETLRSTSTETETVTIWPKHGPDEAIDSTVLINQIDPDITYNVNACCPTTFAMILKWIEKKYNNPLPSPPRPHTDAGLVNLLGQHFKTDQEGTQNAQVNNAMLGLNSFMKSIEPSGPYMFAITYQPWSLPDYKKAIDAGSAVGIRISWADGGGHCAWGIGAGGPTPKLSDGTDMPRDPTWIKGTYTPIILADPWGGRIVYGWVNIDGDLEYFNPTFHHFSHGRVTSFWKVTPKAILGADPVEGYVVVADDRNYYIVSATSFGDVRVTNGKVSGITDGILLRASGPVYGLVNGTVIVPTGVTVSEVNPANFPSLSLSIINGTESIVDPPGMEYYPSLTATLLSPEADASLTTDAVTLTAKVTVNGTGEASSPVEDAEVRFIVNDREVGFANTDSAGVATFEYKPESSGAHSWYVRASSPTYPEDISWPPRQFSVMSRTPNVPYLPYLGLVIIAVVAGAVFARSRSKKRKLATAYPAPPPQPEMEFCFFCGQQIPLNSEFCTNCGERQRDRSG